jgi:hypothetical protein
VLEITNVFLGDNNDNFDSEGEGKETIRSHQETNVQTIMEYNIATRINGHEIMPPPLIIKIIHALQEGSAKGGPNVEVSIDIDPCKLTNKKENITMFPLGIHTSNTNGKKQSHHGGRSNVVD